MDSPDPSRTPSTRACAAATSNSDNMLRASVVDPPEFGRKNTKDNTPAVINVQIVPGDKVDVMVAAKGGGSENKSKFVMLNPSDSIVDWVHEDRADDGRRMVPAGNARHRHRRHRREGDDDGQGGADGRHRHVGPAEARTADRRREAARRTLREGQRARHRRAGPGRTVHRARRQDQDVPDPRRRQAGGDDSELRGDPPRALRARRFGSRLPRAAVARHAGPR